MKIIQITIMAVKYWVQGDDWWFAWEYATSLVNGFKR